MAHGGFSAHPPSIHDHASRTAQRADSVSQTANGLGGAGLPGHALGQAAATSAASHQQVVGRMQAAAQTASQRLHGQSDLLHGTANNIANTESEQQQRFSNIRSGGDTRPALPTPAQTGTTTTVAGHSAIVAGHSDHSSQSGSPPAVTSQSAFAQYRPNMLQGMSHDGNTRYYFSANDVNLRPMNNAHVGPIGVHTDTDPALVANMNAFAQTGNRPFTFYAKPGVRPTPTPEHPDIKVADISLNAGKFEHAPTVDGREPFYIGGHSDVGGWAVTLHDGTEVAVPGRTFAHIINGHDVFQQANASYNPNAYSLLGCNVGRHQGPMGAAYDFQQTMQNEFGNHRPVFASDQVVDTAVLPGGAGATYLENGGQWVKFPPGQNPAGQRP